MGSSTATIRRGVGSDRLDRNSSTQVRFQPDGFFQRQSWRFALVPFAMALATLTSAEVAAQEVPAATVVTPEAPTAATTLTDFSISAGSLSDALHQFSEQSGIQVFFESELVNGKAAPGITGSLQAQDALNALLAGSGLVHQFVNDKTLILRRSPNAAIDGEGAVAAGAVTPLAAEAIATAADDITTESVTSVRRGGIEEIIVTARKREESVQDVPISITALSKEDMKAFGISNVGDMEGIVPGLNMGGGGNGLKKDSNPFIRGVGQRETKVTLDPGVGTYIDGIYLARTGGALLDTVGMERVEVLRGPQGTLFGRNAVGGSISFTTIKPQPGLSGSLTANVGNFGRSDVMAVANVPLIDDVLLSRITLSSKNSEGAFTNVVDNTDWGGDNRITGIGQFRFIPSDDLVFDLLAERTRVRETPRPSKCAVVRPVNKTPSGSPYLTGQLLRDENGQLIRDENGQLVRGPSTVNPSYNPYYFSPGPINTTDFERTTFGNPNGRKTFQQQCAETQALPNGQFASDFSAGGALDADGNHVLDQGRYWIDTATIGLGGTWDIGDLGPLRKLQLKNTAGWREVKQIADEDLDAVALPQLLRVQDGFNESWQFSEELQLTGSLLDDRMFFSSGFYYLKDKTPQDILIRTAGLSQTNVYVGSQAGFQGRYGTTALEATRETLETNNDAYAWYGQIDFNLTPQLQLTAGVRYTYEQRASAYTKAYAVGPSIQSGSVFVRPTDGALSASLDWTATTAYSGSPGLNNVLDWVFYSAEYPCVNSSAMPDCPIAGVPGYEGLSHTLGTAYGREEASTTSVAWTPMASIKYHADASLLDALQLNDAMAYFTYSGGFGAGGVTAGAVDFDVGGFIRIEDPVIFKPQYVHNYEIGLKLQGLDRRVQANLAAFYMDYTDMQITSTADRLGVPIPYIDNVGRAAISGIEAEFIFLPTADWRIVLNSAYTDADLKEWDARVIKLNPFTGQPPNSGTQGAYDTLDRSDEPMPRVPRWQAYLMTDYTFRLATGARITPLIAARYTSEIYHGFDRGSYCFTRGGCNISRQMDESIGVFPFYNEVQVPNARELATSPSVIFLDARLTFLSADGKIEVAAWGRNLTDENDYMVGAIPLVDVTGTVGQVFADPRTFGLTMTYNFGAQ
jgi:iron complex outermembrane receptor protein